MNGQRVLLSRNKLKIFESCQRQFQLRYIGRMPWPTAPIPPQIEAAWQKGALFHRVLEQHFLGLPVELPADADADVAQWWATFQQRPPTLPAGDTFPEFSLTVPIGDHAIFGRFDLLATSPTEAHIFDWKTERKPRTAAQLRDDWQTRLYLAMLVEGGGAIGRSYTPDQVAITYWFARDPEKSVTIRYNSAEHARTLSELQTILSRIDRRLVAADAIWPLTDDWTTCSRCGYRSFCDRYVTAADRDEDAYLEEEVPEDIPEFDAEFSAEPEP